MSKFSRLSRLIVETDSPIAKRVLLLAFSAAFLVYVASANSSRVIVSPWLVGEWLVSYSGGFNRRGLAGSVVLALSDLTGANPLWIVFGIQVLLIAGILTILYKKITSRPLPLGVMVALFSPMALSYFLVDPGGVAGRKEYALFLVAILWFSFQDTNQQFQRIGWRQSGAFILFGIAFCALVLSHEGFLFFLPLLAIPLVFRLVLGAKPSWTWIATSLSTLTLPSLAALFAITILRAEPTFDQMCSPLTSRQVPERVCQGAIAWSVNSGSAGLEFAIEQTSQYVENYGLYYVIALISLVFIYSSYRALHLEHLETAQVIVANVLITMLAASSIPLFIIAHDWGRYISISASLISLGLLFTHSYSSPELRGTEFFRLSASEWPSPKVKTRLLLTLVMIWLFFGVRSYRGDYLSIAYSWATTIYFALR